MSTFPKIPNTFRAGLIDPRDVRWEVVPFKAITLDEMNNLVEKDIEIVEPFMPEPLVVRRRFLRVRAKKLKRGLD